MVENLIIYTDPTAEFIREYIKDNDANFIVSQDNTLYMWNAKDALHKEVMEDKNFPDVSLEGVFRNKRIELNADLIYLMTYNDKIKKMIEDVYAEEGKE